MTPRQKVKQEKDIKQGKRLKRPRMKSKKGH
jgi:hypothetical protein